MSDPLAGDSDWHGAMELHLRLLERRGVPAPHQVADQRAVVARCLCAGAVGGPGRLHDCVVCGLSLRREAWHHVDQRDEPMLADVDLTTLVAIHDVHHWNVGFLSDDFHSGISLLSPELTLFPGTFGSKTKPTARP
jgi:hypothetical protein